MFEGRFEQNSRMSNIAKNLKFLRRKHGHTQEVFARNVGVNRPNIGAYEEGRAEPRLSTLLSIAKAYDVSCDDLIAADLSDLDSEGKLGAFGSEKTRVLALTLDPKGNELISVVPQKAAAGYSSGYADSEFIEELPQMSLPDLERGSHRAFEVRGDSMLPIRDGTLVVGKYVDSKRKIRDGKSYIVITKNDGIVYKRLRSRLKESNSFILESDNPMYAPFEVQAEDVLELWEAVAFVAKEFPSAQDTPSLSSMMEMVLSLKNEVEALKTKK